MYLHPSLFLQDIMFFLPTLRLNYFLLLDQLMFEVHSLCNILTFDPAVKWETGASGWRYLDITLTVDGLNSVQMRHSQEAGGYQTIIWPSAIVGVSYSWILSCSSRQWEPVPSRGLGPSGPPVEQPSRMRKEVLL